jgi:hypothetical protein
VSTLAVKPFGVQISPRKIAGLGTARVGLSVAKKIRLKDGGGDF